MHDPSCLSVDRSESYSSMLLSEHLFLFNQSIFYIVRLKTEIATRSAELSTAKEKLTDVEIRLVEANR